MIVFYRTRGKKQSLWWLALIACLATLNRMDTFLLFLPTLIVVFCQFPGWKSVRAVVLGFAPFICWEMFSLCYYGFLFPNTAYAKLDTGISSVQLLWQGIGYLISSLTFDPLIFGVMGASVVLLLQQRAWKDLPILLGMGLYLLYTVKVGGDFMAGRFLTEPFLIAVILLVHTTFPVSKSNIILAVAIVLPFVLAIPNSRWYPLIKYNVLIDQRGVADEHDFYVNETGILNVLHNGLWSNSRMVEDALQIKQSGQKVVVCYSIGIFGFTVGPSVHVVDRWALSDPLLARLPTQPRWRIGHFERAIPAGYIETLESGKNVIRDKQLALYYSKLQEVTRGPLFDIQRWIDIWELNTGAYNYLLDPCLSTFCPSKTL
jgi:arabinofuranosyltransferase